MGWQQKVNLKGADGVSPDISKFIQFVFVVTGDEERPDAPLVFWIEQREGEVSAPTNFGESDIRFRPGVIASGDAPPTIITTSLNSMTIDEPFAQAIITSGTAPFTFSITIGDLPSGLILDEDSGFLYGTPTVDGTGSITVTAENDEGFDSQELAWTVADVATAPTVTTSVLNSMIEGEIFSQQLLATGDTPITWDVISGSWPDGITMDSSGLISGTPTTNSSGSVTVEASNSAGSDTQTLTWTVDPAEEPNSSFSIFGTSAPGTSQNVNSDGGGSLYVGSRFYTALVGGIIVTGARVWNPVGADSTFLNTDATVRAYKNDWIGSSVNGSTTFGSSVLATKTETAARIAGTWTDIYFDTPITLPAIAVGSGIADLLTIAVGFAGGQYYVTANGMSTGAIESSEQDDVYLTEDSGVGRSINTLVSGIAGSDYAVDLLFELP